MPVEVHTNGGGGSGGSAFIGFICGAVLLAVAVVGFFMWDNYKSGATASKPGITLNIKKS